MKRILYIIYITVSIAMIYCGSPDSSNTITFGTSTPDYDVVFPQDEVKRLDIKISPSDWQAMIDDMSEMYGEFGTGEGGVMEIPEEMCIACQGMDVGDSCTINFEGMEIEGTCSVMQSQIVCLPDDEEQIGGAPPGGAPPGGGGGQPGGAPPGGGLTMVDRNPIWAPCTVSFEGNTWWYVGVRFKGNSSLRGSWQSGNYKFPFRLDFDQFEEILPEISNQRFYGFKKLTMSSGYSDNSLIREKVAADIFRDAGVPAPMTAFYRLFIDYGEGPIYFGLYTMVEPPYYPMLEMQFGDDGGNLYKPDGLGATFAEFDTESFVKDTNEDDSDWSDVIAVFSALHGSRDDPEIWRNNIERVLDVEGFLKWLAVNTVIQNWDTYGKMSHNYYIYSNPQDGLIHWIPWDNNMSLSDQMGGQGVLSLSLDEVDDSWPLIRYLIDDPEYRAIYIVFMEEFVDNVFTINEMRERYQIAHDLIEPYVTGTGGEISGYTHVTSTQAFYDELDYLFDHVQERNDAVEQFLLDNE